MNIESTNIGRTNNQTQQVKSQQNTDSSVKFADELKEMKKEEVETKETKTKETTKEAIVDKNDLEPKVQEEKISQLEDKKLDKALKGLNSVVKEFNQSEDNLVGVIKNSDDLTDNKNMINNDYSVQDNKDLLPQMNPNMNFSGDGQPFSSFMNNDSQTRRETKLSNNAQDLAEEAAILSTMAENIAIANKNQILKDTHTITNSDGVKKVESYTGVLVETVVKFDSVIMNQADVEVFANLVQNGEVNLKNLAPQAAEKAVHVSKTLADLLAKSMENNQPLRIDFDNNISVIIKVSREGKITADFLPSSQIAEAYLKENLPLLKQRFDENNIEYDSLNQRERKENNKENNRKKERNNE